MLAAASLELKAEKQSAHWDAELNVSVAEMEKRVAAARAAFSAGPPAPAGTRGGADPEPLRRRVKEVETQMEAAAARKDYVEAGKLQEQLKTVTDQVQQAEREEALRKEEVALEAARRREEAEKKRQAEEAVRASAGALFPVGSDDQKRPRSAAEWLKLEPPLAKVGLTTALVLDYKEGKRCSFWFIRAAKLRDFSGTTPPRMQELRRNHPDWLEQRKISFTDGHAEHYVSNTLVISHRWEEPAEPDSSGVQFSAIKQHLLANEAIEWVWFDFWSMPQGRNKTEVEDIEFTTMLPNINLLYLFCSVLILLDGSYMSRFWTQFEAFLSFRKVTASGLGPTPLTERRDAIICIHNADPEFDPPKLRKMWGDRTVDEAHEVLAKPDVEVTNKKDKEVQLPKLQRLNDFTKNVLADSEIKELRLGTAENDIPELKDSES